MTVRLPDDIDPTDFDGRYRLDPAAWLEAVREVCAAHGLSCDRELAPFSDGSNLVVAVDGRLVVKIFPPFHRHQWESERRVLPRLHGRLGVRVPALLAEGERDDGWPYVIVELLPGTLLEARWSALDRSSQRALLSRIGRTIAELHALPVGDLATLPPEWTAFAERQVAGCRARHARLGMPAWLLDGVDDLVRACGAYDGDRVILTGEHTPFNLLVEPSGAGWELSGMIDLGDAMIGPREYDLLGPSLFLCEGDRELVGALFGGYGIGAIDDRLRTRLIALAVLHRYANFDVQLRIPGWRERAGSLEELALLVWPR